MISKLWFRFAIPLGSATVLAALLEFTVSCYWFLNYFGSFVYTHTYEDVPLGFRTIFGLCIIFLKIILAFFLWGFILLGRRGILLLWLPISIIADFLLVGFGIYNTTHDLVSDEVWFINLAVVIILRFYITIVILQTLGRLLQNAKVEHPSKTDGPDDQSRKNELELHDINITKLETKTSSPQFNKNKVDIVVEDPTIQNNAPEEASSTKYSPRFLLIEPVGESIDKILEFYNNTPRLGAAILVMFEFIWNIFALSTHSLTEFLLGGGMFFIKEEELRIWRIILNLVGLLFIFRKKKTLLRFWLIAYLWTLFASLCMFVYVLADWFYPPEVQIINVCAIFCGDNFIRFGVVYFVLRTTIQPPAVTPSSDFSPTGSGRIQVQISQAKSVSRSHSLTSQTGPRIKRNSLSKSTRKKYGTRRLYTLTDPDLELY